MKDHNLASQMLAYESQAREKGFTLVIGLDEAGRGPLAGPVVAAAVAVKNPQFRNKITDSKKLSPLARETAFHEIHDNAYVGIGVISESIIDSVNILEATYIAMSHAVVKLMEKLPADTFPEKNRASRTCLLVDGNRFKTELPYFYKTIVDGDSLSLSIACASIIAKVTRDRILNIYDRVFPQYGFRKHKGYPTAQHLQAIKEHGPSLIHRRTFRF